MVKRTQKKAVKSNENPYTAIVALWTNPFKMHHRQQYNLWVEISERPNLYRTPDTNKVKLATLVEGDPKAPFLIATTPRCREGRYSIPWIALLYSWCCIAVIHIQLYTYTCGNKINNNDERTHFFRKIYLSHFIRKGCERVMCERWVGDWTDCNILTPSSSVFSSTSFSFCWAAQPGVLRVQPSLGASYFQLTEPVCGNGLYNSLTLTCFLWASHLHPIQPVHSQGYTLISSTGCTCYLHRCISYLTARLRVNMLHWSLPYNAEC